MSTATGDKHLGGQFSDTVMEHFHNPRNVGHELPEPRGIGCCHSRRKGVTIRILVRVAAGRVQDACFGTHGCVAAIASASALTEWAKGRSVAEVAAITAEELTTALGGLPPGRRFCAALAVGALRAALEDASEAEMTKA